MPSVESFPTKRGRARFEDGIVVFEESVRGYVRSLYRGYWRSDAWWRKAMFAGYVVAWVAAIAWVLTAMRHDLLLVAAGLLVLAALWVIQYLRGYRSPDRVALDDVADVSVTRGSKGLTRPRLVLTYRTGDGRYKRRVNLPSRLTPNGDEAYKRAVTAFEQRGFEPRGGPRDGER
ncbi:hypothetical protein [Halarchaeum sp. P4]|uniref:hypothetical protein n=1 Tax=Halarchaeum sp. P4 TaxID=3421639 RepID=UPI003EB7DE0B